ncbi:MAG: SURF1 family protein [Pseudomonadota bacterium]
MRYLFALILGFGGLAILLWLGFWQLDRLAWKEGKLAEIDGRMQAEPVALPPTPVEVEHSYLRVLVTGDLTGDEIHILTSQKNVGPGFLVISKLVLGDGRAVLVDLGFVAEARKAEARPEGAIEVTGNLLWPNEVDPRFTPDPDLGRNIWFARDLPAMAKALGAEPILVVASAARPAPENMPKPIRVATNIPNDHLEYAVTWFSMAVCWLAMTVYLIWRIRRRTI